MDAGELALYREVQRLERQQKKLDSRMDNADAMQFTVHPTCPPSVGFYVHGGRIAMIPSWDGVTYYLTSGTVDLQTHTESYWDYVFTNANWYLPLYMTISWYYTAWDGGYAEVTDAVRFHGAEPGPGFGYWGGGFVEYATAAEAEAAIDTDPPLPSTDYIIETGIPCCRLILRNNGNTTLPNQFQPVDAVNRGRSYLWGQYRDGRDKL